MQEQVYTGWKFLRAGMRSSYGDVTWKVGEWQEPIAKLVACEHGYHGSDTPLEALFWVKGEILTRFEARGELIYHTQKTVHAEMRIIEARYWTKRDSVMLAVFAARLVLDKFESRYPNDKRARQNIEAAEGWLTTGVLGNRNYTAAAAADAAAAAAAAADVAADVAAYAAAARSAVNNQIAEWMIRHFSKLQSVE